MTSYYGRSRHWVVVWWLASSSSSSRGESWRGETNGRVLDPLLVDGRRTRVLWRREESGVWDVSVGSVRLAAVPSRSGCRGELWVVARGPDERSWIFADCDFRLRSCDETEQSCLRPERALLLDDAAPPALFEVNGSVWTVGAATRRARAHGRPTFELVEPLRFECGQCRDVQVAALADGRLTAYAFDKGLVVARGSAAGPWINFQPIALGQTVGAGEVYSAAVATNPILPTTLLGLFAVVRNQRSSIDLALSCDALHFTPLRPVLEVDQRRDVPLQGLVALEDSIFFYVAHDLDSNVSARVAKYSLPTITLSGYMNKVLPNAPGCRPDIGLQLQLVFPSTTRSRHGAPAAAQAAASPPHDYTRHSHPKSKDTLESTVLRLLAFFVIELIIVVGCLYAMPPPEFFQEHQHPR